MAGAAVSGGLVMAFGNELRAPHGGLWVIALISKPVLYLLAVAIGAANTASLTILLMSLDPRNTETLAHAEDVAEGVIA